MTAAQKKQVKISEKKLKKVSKTKPRLQDEDQTGSAIDTSAVDAQALLSAWKEQVTRLENRTFADQDEALRCVVDEVLVQLKTPGPFLDLTRQFLLDLFSTDPDLREELCGCLTIRK